MKKSILALVVFTSSMVSAEPLSTQEKAEIELLLAEAASKLIYLNQDCDKPIDAEKVQELAKVKAFSEGHVSIEGISWENIKRTANIQYGALKIAAPMGEMCIAYKQDLQGKYQFLKDINA